MKPQPAHVPHTVDDTRSRLIQAAGEVFADVGYREAKVRDICGRAGANVAAVNYHFGDKLRLYSEVLRYAVCIESSDGPSSLPERVGPGDGKLAFFVKRLLRGMNDPARPAWATRLMLHEMAQPTQSLGGVVEEMIRPKYDVLRGLIAEMLDLPVNHRATHLCAHSIIGQVRHYAIGRCVINRLWPEMQFTTESLDQIAAHITMFSIEGMNAVRKSVETGEGYREPPGEKKRNDRASTV